MSSFSEKLKLFFSAIGDFLYPFIKQFMSNAGQLLLNSASRAVMAVANDPSILNSADKQKAAFNNITKDLAAAGVTMSVSVINGAIEAAYTKMKYDQQKAAQAAAAPEVENQP